MAAPNSVSGELLTGRIEPRVRYHREHVLLPIRTDSVPAIYAEQYGYLSQRFGLEPDASSRLSVLRLEPSPIVLEGIEVVDDQAVTTILRLTMGC